MSQRQRGSEALPTSLLEMARVFRRLRTRQGLRLEDISARSGLSLEHLQILESGSLERANDPVGVMRTFKKYVDFLGLPGDRYVVAIIDNWPIHDNRPSMAFPIGHGGAVSPMSTGIVQRVSASGIQQVVETQTSVVPAVGTSTVVVQPDLFETGIHIPEKLGQAEDPNDTGYVQISHNQETGMVQAVPGQYRKTKKKQARAPLFLRVVIVIVSLAIVAGVAGIAIQHYRPQWLQKIGIETSQKTKSQSTSTTTHSTKPLTPAQIFTITSSSPTTATFIVHGSPFAITVSDSGIPSWVQVTSPAQNGAASVVTFAATMTPGQSKSFFAKSDLKIQTGSTGAHISIAVGSKSKATYVPTAPVTMTFHAETAS